MVSVCAPARPMRRPARPAMLAATSGSRTIAISSLGFMRASSLQRIEVFDVDRAALAEQHHEDCEPDGGLRRCDREHEEHEYLPADIAEVTRESDEIEV